MLRSMFSGVSALRSFQLKLDVIGNNMANVLTVGFKGSTVTFKEMYNQNLRGASSSTPTRGGTNAQQVGLGTSVSSINVNHTKGSIQRTEVPTHLMVDGNGFFMVSTDPNGLNKFYTRAGDFELDELGFLVTPDGMKVLDLANKPVQINMNDTKSASASQFITVKGNIDKKQGDYTTTIDVFDSLGDVHTINVDFLGDRISTTAKQAIDGQDPAEYPAGVTEVNYSYKRMQLRDTDGNIMAPDPADPPWFLKFNESGEFVDLVTLGDPNDPNSASTPVSSELIMSVPGAADIKLPLDRRMFYANADVDGGVRTITQVSKESDAKGVQLYGVAAGKINSFEISSKGEVVAKYSNGESRIIHVIGLADFDNPSGLLKVGNNLFQTTPNSGVPKFGMPQTGSFGGLQAGALEMSNVDLAAQFTELIMTQRGLQANGRVITTSDEILQELVNLKR